MLHVLCKFYLFSVVVVLGSAAVIHECLNGLFSVDLLGFQFVQWIIKHLSVVAEELAELLEIDLDNSILVEKLSDDMEDVL